MAKNSLKGARFTTLPEELLGVVDVARRQTDGILKTWIRRGDLDLRTLVVSAYLQGISDGFEAGESNATKKTGEITE